MPQGWQRLPKSHPQFSPTKRLYLSPQNEVVSRRQYDNARLITEGWESKADFDSRFSARKDRGYARWVSVASENLGVSEKELTRAGSDFNDLFLRARDDKWSNNPDGSFAELLEFIGLRRPDAAGDIGEDGTGYA